MKTTLLLCDNAQEVAGKLYVLGGGWSIYRGSPVSMALAVKIAVPWDAANVPHDFAARLVTEDGDDPMLTGPDGAVTGVAAVLRDDTAPWQERRAQRDEIARLRAQVAD